MSKKTKAIIAGGESSPEYGEGFSEKSLRRMIQFAAVFPDQRITDATIELDPFSIFHPD